MTKKKKKIEMTLEREEKEERVIGRKGEPQTGKMERGKIEMIFSCSFIISTILE